MSRLKAWIVRELERQSEIADALPDPEESAFDPPEYSRLDMWLEPLIAPFWIAWGLVLIGVFKIVDWLRSE